MNEKYISSAHIEKLGHPIEEIRVRALKNIISKLNNRFIYDNALARSREIFLKLLKWFSFEPVCCEEDVLKLLKRILETDSGATLIKYFGPEKLITELSKIKSYVTLQSYGLVNGLIDFVRSKSKEEESKCSSEVVPPLLSEVPLSFRSENDNLQSKPVLKDFGNINSLSHTASREINTNFDLDNREYVDESVDDDRETLPSKDYQEPIINLEWIPMIISDRHVLSSVEDSLKSPDEPSVLLHTCNFFKDVMLQDFPAEVFLQRPKIILYFYDYLKKTSSGRFQTALLSCLNKLIHNLIIRTEFCIDPNTSISKHGQNVLNQYITRNNRNEGSITPESILEDYDNENNTNHKDQISLPQFCCDVLCTCFELIKKIVVELEEKDNNISKPGKIYNCFFVINNSIILLKLCVSPEIWFLKSKEYVADILVKINETLIKFGDILELLRIAMTTNEEVKILRVIYLHLICNCLKLLDNVIPDNELGLVLPNSLKVALINSLSDAIFARLYPKVYEVTLSCVQKFQDTFKSSSVRKYKEISEILNSVTSAVKFLKHFKDLSSPLVVELADESLISLDLHKNLTFINKFVFLCTRRNIQAEDEILTKAQGIILKLLAHNDGKIQEETYKSCHKIVVKSVGPTFTDPSNHSNIVFLLNSEIFNEIAVFGMNNTNKEIQKLSEEILVYILKCKVLVTDDIWNKVVQTFIISFPVLICHICKRSNLGRTVMGILDPDTAHSLNIPKAVVIKGNIGVLFVNDTIVREEAISRLLWLLSSQTGSIDLSPRLSSLANRELNSLCLIRKSFDINKCYSSQKFYQSNSVYQIMDILNCEKSEPVVIRSALTQMSVMMEDPSLITVFLDQNGLRSVIDKMKEALNEKHRNIYPDSVIPAITILKNICLYCPRVRHTLKYDTEALFWIFRGFLAHYGEERVRMDAVILLFLLVFGDYILGTPKEGDMSLPVFFFDKITVPFQCNKHWKTSKNSMEALASILLADKWSLNCLKIHWNAEWYGGITNILKWEELPYDPSDTLEFNNLLMLTEYDLKVLKKSFLNYNLKELLDSLRLDTSHKKIISNINWLVCCLSPYVNHADLLEFDFDEFSTLPWEKTFNHFLSIPPAEGGDIFLLTDVLRCLQYLVQLYPLPDQCWINSLLKDENHSLSNILQEKVQDDPNAKTLHQELMQLISICVKQENKSILKKKLNHKDDEKNWNCVIKIITQNLKAGQSQYFYNLAYLDYQLTCLVHLTGSFDWCVGKDLSTESIGNLVRVILDLVTAFHEGKGETATLSLMGIGVIRNSVLILNHLLMELQRQDIKNWETYFIGDPNDEDEKNNLKKLLSLKGCRDVLLRAASFQLLAGLSTTPKGAAELNKELWSVDNTGLWQNSLGILWSEDNAMIVRECAGNMLSNLIGHIAMNTSRKALVTLYLTQEKATKKVDCSSAVLLLLEECKFFIDSQELITCTVEESLKNKTGFAGAFLQEKTKNHPEMTGFGINGNSETLSDVDNFRKSPATPGLLRYLASLIQNLIELSPNSVMTHLQQFGLLSLFFRCITNPAMEITCLKDMMRYCDIIEMNISICSLLTKAIENCPSCIYCVINAKDCLHYLLSLLNTSVYYTYQPYLLRKRNRMWKGIFILIKTLINTAIENKNSNENFEIVSENIQNVISSLMVNDDKQFLETVTEALVSENSTDLQNSALTSLSSLLQVDVLSPVTSNVSWRCLLDSVKTSRTELNETEVMVHDLENIEPLKVIDTNKKSSVEVLWNRKKLNSKRVDKEKRHLIQNVYYRNILDQTTSQSSISSLKESKSKNNQDIVAGGELCRILIYLYRASHMDTKNTIRKTNTIRSLTNLLYVSREAKKQAMEETFLHAIVLHLRDIHIRLSLESVDFVRHASSKKNSAILKEVEGLIGLITNFMHDCRDVKKIAAELELSDLTHKLWVWFIMQRKLLESALKMLCTFTADCEEACRTLPFTSATIGSGLRKSLSNASLLNEIYSLIMREMEKVSRTHDLQILTLCLQFLQNCCISSDCRHAMNKSNIFQNVARLHPSITKGQKPWERVELLWMNFLRTYTTYSEGQLGFPKNQDAFSTLLTLISDTRTKNNHEALLVLRNVAFNSVNRPRLLNCGEFLNILHEKLLNDDMEGKQIASCIIWALAANNQRAKLIFKCSGIKDLLKDSIHRISYSSEVHVDKESLKTMKYVLDILKED